MVLKDFWLDFVRDVRALYSYYSGIFLDDLGLGVNFYYFRSGAYFIGDTYDF